MILNFRSKETEIVWRGETSRRLPPEIQQTARRKLRMLNNARSLIDLRIPPANRLDIRINDQWRICFVWTDTGPANVEIVDYH